MTQANTEQEIEEYLQRLADEHEEWFHKFYPDGMTVATYCNSNVPGDAFLKGARAAKRVWELRGKAMAFREAVDFFSRERTKSFFEMALDEAKQAESELAAITEQHNLSPGEN